VILEAELRKPNAPLVWRGEICEATREENVAKFDSPTFSMTTKFLGTSRSSGELIQILCDASTLSEKEDAFEKAAGDVYALVKAHNEIGATYKLLSFFDCELHDRDYAECIRAFRLLDVTKMTSAVAVSALAVTIRAKNLTGRKEYFKKCFAKVAAEKGTAYAKRLLDKYK
jgi:hypothetical protein